jgi:hypothetical protein
MVGDVDVMLYRRAAALLRGDAVRVEVLPEGKPGSGSEHQSASNMHSNTQMPFGPFQ